MDVFFYGVFHGLCGAGSMQMEQNILVVVLLGVLFNSNCCWFGLEGPRCDTVWHMLMHFLTIHLHTMTDNGTQHRL